MMTDDDQDKVTPIRDGDEPLGSAPDRAPDNGEVPHDTVASDDEVCIGCLIAAHERNAIRRHKEQLALISKVLDLTYLLVCLTILFYAVRRGR